MNKSSGILLFKEENLMYFFVEVEPNVYGDLQMYCFNGNGLSQVFYASKEEIKRWFNHRNVIYQQAKL